MDLLTEEEVTTLREIAASVRERNAITGYGYFPGGDLWDFTPDEEVCSALELEAYTRALSLYEKGEIQQLGAAGNAAGCCAAAQFGVGTYTIKDSEVERLAQELDDLVDAIRKLEG